MKRKRNFQINFHEGWVIYKKQKIFCNLNIFIWWSAMSILARSLQRNFERHINIYNRFILHENNKETLFYLQNRMND